MLMHLMKNSRKSNSKPSQVKMINDYISNLLDEHIIGLGTLHPDYGNIDGEIERIIELGLSGVKFHPINLLEKCVQIF